MNGDGVPDTIVGAGPGAMGGAIKVLDGVTGAELFSFFAFEGFSGGVFVASGDVNGDGRADIIVSADAGATPHVKVFSGLDGSLLRSFYAFDAGYSGGVRVAAGDVNGDGYADIIVGSGVGASHVEVFSGADGTVLQSFIAFDGFSGGVYVGAGDLNNDGFADVIVGAGAGAPGGHVEVFSGADGSLLSSFFAYDSGFLGGARVGSGQVNGTTALLAGAGPGAGPHLEAFSITGELVLSLFVADPDFTEGVYVD